MPRPRTKPLHVKKQFTNREKLLKSGIEPMDTSLADTSFKDKQPKAAFLSKDTEEFMNFRERTKEMMTASRFDRMGKELQEWSLNDPSATRINKFFSARGIPMKAVESWLAKKPNFKEDFNQAKLNIADRLFDGVLTRSYSDRLVPHMMNIYDDEWREESKRQANLKEEQRIADLQRPLKVILEDFSKESDNGEGK